MKLFPIILCGGHGTRLWPLSREKYPKQFHALFSEHSLLQETVARVAGRDWLAPLVVTNEEQRFMVGAQLRAIDCKPAGIVLEPVGRGTAPAIAVAALLAERQQPDAALLVLPSDHRIADLAAFHAAIDIGLAAAAAGRIVTFGIKPTYPATGYGYIRRGDGGEMAGAYAIAEFHEKPDAATAAGWLAAGNWLWNGGIFLLPCAALLAEFEQYCPELLAQCRTLLAQAQTDGDFLHLPAEAFAALPSAAFDVAIMERTKHGCVVPMEAEWSDLGSWPELWNVGAKDAQGNVVIGDVVALDSSNCYLRSEDRLTAAIGLDGLIIVATDDAVLVADADKADLMRPLMQQLERQGRVERSQYPTVYRPWGSYRSLAIGPRFQVKHITILPQQRISLQMHYHRAEHWVVVSGTAKVTRDGEEIMLNENESIYIPLGSVHRLENLGRIPLEIIEVQSGSYLGEDDIVRFEDAYGRVAKDKDGVTAG